MFGDPASKYFPQKTQGKPYKRTSKKGKINSMGFGAKDNYVYGSIDGMRHPDRILDFPQKWRRQDQKHSTQKPVELIEYLLKSYSEENDIVLDFTAGSFTLAEACINTNRNYIVIEKDKTEFKKGSDRINLHKKLANF